MDGSGRRNSLPGTFLGITVGGSIALSVLVGVSGGYRSPLAGLGWLTMFLPALGVLVVRLHSGIPVDGQRVRFSWRWLPVALLTLPLAIHAVALPGVEILEGRLPWVPWLTAQPDGLYHAPEQLGWGTLTLPALLGRIAVNAVVGLLVVSALAFFEEIGWRAFLLPRLVERMGVRRGLWVSALICAAWHVPFAISGIQHVENVSPLALAVTSVPGQIGAALFLGVLWLKTGSLPLVSLAHGALNNWGQYAFKFMSTSGERDQALFGLVNLALLLAGVGALVWMGMGARSRWEMGTAG